MYFTQNTNDSTMPPNQKLILKSHKTIISGCVQKPASISLTLKPKYPHLPQVQLQPLYMGRGTNWVQHAGKCSWKFLLLAMLACPDAHHLQPKTYKCTKTIWYYHSIRYWPLACDIFRPHLLWTFCSSALYYKPNKAMWYYQIHSPSCQNVSQPWLLKGCTNNNVWFVDVTWILTYSSPTPT